MKTLPPTALAQLQGRAPILAGAIKAVFPSATYRLWSGYGDLTIDAEVYKGVGARALITPISSAIGGAADGLTVTLSPLEPDIAQTIELEDYHHKPVTIRRLVFDPTGATLLGHSVFMRGRLDTVVQRETAGGETALDFIIEGPRRDMSRTGGRIRGDSDQRSLGGANDAAFKHIAVAGQKTLSWGQRPAAEPIARDFGGGGLFRNF